MTIERLRSELSLPNDVPVEIRSSATATVEGVDFKERVISLIVVPYGERAVVEHHGKLIEEEIEPGAFSGLEAAAGHVTANRDHDYSRTVGKAISHNTTDRRGLISELRVSRTSLGDETLQLAADGVLKASVGMLIRRSDAVVRDGVRRVKRAFLDHIALVPNPAYAGSAILAVRQGQQWEQETPASTPNMDRLLSDPVIAAVMEGPRS